MHMLGALDAASAENKGDVFSTTKDRGNGWDRDRDRETEVETETEKEAKRQEHTLCTPK